jgi:hypothetical protein
LQKSLGQRAEISLVMGFSAEIIHGVRFHRFRLSMLVGTSVTAPSITKSRTDICAPLRFFFETQKK